MMKKYLILLLLTLNLLISNDYNLFQQDSYYLINEENIYKQALSGDKNARLFLLSQAAIYSSETLSKYLARLIVSDFDAMMELLEHSYSTDNRRFKIYKNIMDGVTREELYKNRKDLMYFYFKKNNLIESKKTSKYLKEYFYLFFNKRTLGEIKTSSDKCVNAIYSPINICDDDDNTAWISTGASGGIDEWIKITFQNYKPELNKFSRIVFINGNNHNKKAYYEYNRLKKIKLRFSTGQKMVITLNDTSEKQYYEISNKRIKHVKIDIISIYKGTKYNNAALSEIKFIY